MINNTLRVGNFTSSEIHRLMTKSRDGGFGKPAITYIQEKNMERRLGRSLGTDVGSRATSWGNLVEMMAFNLLGLEYKMTSTDTIRHPKIPFWSGSPDCQTFRKEPTVVDIKCPATLKSFCTLADCKTPEDLVENHSEGEKYYWQLVSNAILLGVDHAELIAYCPYKHELDIIREMASNYDGNQNKIAWIGFAEDADLPYILEGKHYQNINVLRFEVPQADKALLTDRVLLAGKQLEKLDINEATPIFDEKKEAAAHKAKLILEMSKRLSLYKQQIP